MAWICVGCGGSHDELPLSYRTGPPVLWTTLPPEIRERSVLDDELCVVRPLRGDDAHFIRANLEIPVVDADGAVFAWTVWCSLSRENFKAALGAWDRPGREGAAPMFGWFSSELSPYPSTLNLPTMIHTRPVGQRPTVELEPSTHPLAVEQRNGITMRRVEEIAAAVLHH